MEDLTGKHILITGGSSGIGLQVIRKCLEQGATKIAALDIRDTDDALANLQTEFPKQEVVYFQTDVTNKANVWLSFESAKASFGHLDVVIGNAGVCDESRPELTIQVNLMGIIHTTYAAIDFLSKSKGGRGGVLLNIASLASFTSLPGGPSYSASKHGVVGFMKAFAHEFYYNKHGLKFITTCPGFTSTSFITNAVRYEFDLEIFDAIKKLCQEQTVDQAADSILRVLRTGNHGSIWTNDGGDTVEVTK